MSLLNQTAIKQLILATAAETRFKKFNRVSDEWFPFLEAVLREHIDRAVRVHPTVGKTLYPPTHGKEKES
jgi:hypothetical protein